VAWEPGKPSSNEDEYFAKRDAEWIRERRAELDRQEKAAATAATAIKCPRCGTPLAERQFQTVKLDACPKCKGVWFDAGELEMVMLLKRGDQIRVVSGLAK
jgi:uncharacterized protein